VQKQASDSTRISNKMTLTRPTGYVFSVAQSCTLSVSVRIVAGRANFPERGCGRSTSRSTVVIPSATRCGWVFDLSRAPFWLRLRRTLPYRGFVICVASQRANAWNRSDTLPNIIRRYGRLKSALRGALRRQTDTRREREQRARVSQRTILPPHPMGEGRAFAPPKRLRPRRRGEVSLLKIRSCFCTSP
jgi:hypothetical protein